MRTQRLPIGIAGAGALALSLAACSALSEGGTSDSTGGSVSGPVTIIIPNAAGGLADNSVRPIQQPLQAKLGVDVVIENMPGAGGMIAANNVYDAEPDGNTLLAVVQPSAVLSDIYEEQSPPYQEFEFIGRLTGDDSMALAVRPDSEYNSVEDVVRASDNGEELLNATISGMNNQTLAQVVFSENTGVAFTDVPYEGGSETTRAVIDGTADVAFASLSSLSGPVEDGEIEVLTYFSDDPIDQYADYPLFADEYEGAGFTAGVGVVATPGTPDDVLTQLRDALELAAGSDDYVDMASGSVNVSYLGAESWKEQFNGLYDLMDEYSDALDEADGSGE